LSLVRIISTGTSIPKKIISNSDLEKIVDTNDEWITARTGIKERRMADENHASSDLGVEASLKAIERASLDPKDIDVIIVGTITPDYIFPSTSCLVQERIGAKNAYAFDLSAGCSGYLYAMQVAKSLIDGGSAETILVIGTETMTRVLDYKDRGTCILFGDGAGATILQKSDKQGILSICLGSDGGGWDLLYLPGGGSRMPPSEQSVKDKMHYLKMKVFMNISKYGNTSSASVPIALDEALEEGRIKEGDLVLFSAFGAGFTWGASVIQW
jgi:3-oxoacyl-[acyl-carrier-protein] synthase-3